MKKILSLMIIITILTAMSAAAADTEDHKDDFIYVKDTNIIVDYVGTTGICEIPEGSVLNALTPAGTTGAPITKLIINKDVELDLSLTSESAKLNSLKEVEIREGVTEIPYHFLDGCANLERVSLPSTIVKIDDYAFRDCPKLKSIELKDGLQSIGDYAFCRDTALSGDLIIPDTVTYMGNSAFSDCGRLDKVHLSNNLSNKTDDGRGWFAGTEVKEINIPDAMLDDPPVLRANEITFNSDMTVKIYKAVRDSVWCREKYLKGKTDKALGGCKDFAIAEDTVLKYLGDDKNPVVPEGIKSITEYAFAYRDMDTVTLPKSLESIETSAFAYTTLKEVTIPENVKTVSDGAFRECELIEKVTFEGAPEVGSAFPESGFLTRENVIIKDNAIKLSKDFYSFEDVENNLDYFYKMLANNGVNADKSPAQEPTSTPAATPEPKAKPEETPTPSPTPVPKTLEVNGADMSISVDGKAVEFPDAKPFVDDNDRTQVPIRAVAEMLDCSVDWNGDTKTATVTREGGDVITLRYGSDFMTVNGKDIKMDTSVIIKDNRTYIPVRFVAETLGLAVEWK